VILCDVNVLLGAMVVGRIKASSLESPETFYGTT